MKESEIRLSGSGGQGILLACRILAEALTMEGMQIAQSQHYEPTSRGGLSRSDLIVSDGAIEYPLADRLDYLVVLDQVAVGVSDELLDSASTVLIDAVLEDGPDQFPCRYIRLPISETACGLNDPRSANMVALGALVNLGELCPLETLSRAVETVVPAKLVSAGKEAMQAGYLLLPEG